MAKSVLQGGGSLAAKLALAKDENRNRNSGNTRSSKPDVSVTYSDPLLGKKASTKNSNNEVQEFSAFENNSGNRLSSIKTETYTPRYSNTSNTIDSVSEDDFKSQTTGTTDITQEVTQEPYDGMAGRIGMDQPQVGSEEWVRQKSQEEADRLVQEELQQISRAGQLFDRQVENQQISTDRSVEDIQRDADRVKQDRDFQLEEYRTNAMRQMADTKQQRDQTLQAIRKQGAAMGLNMTSTFYDNYENTMQKFNNVINRVKEDLNTVEGRSQLENQRLDEDVNRMTKRLLEDHEMNIGRLNEDFRFATRNLQNDMIVDANALVEKYGLSSDKLGARIQELGLQAFNAVNQAYSSYLSNVDTQTDILDKQVNSVLDTRDKFLKQEKEYAQSFLDSSMNRNKNDLESLVLQGFISEREAQNVLGEMIQSTIDTLDTISTTGVGIQFQDEIVNGLNEGKTPNQIMTEIYNTPEFQQAIETASQTDPFFDLKRQQMQQGLESGDLDLQTQILQNQKVSQELLEKVEEAGGLEGIVQYSQTKRGKEKLQCGELVNDYWTKITGSRAGVGDTYESKVAAIQKAGQTEYPVEGGMFAYSTGEGNPGHVGIVTSVFPDGSIEVLEANREGSMDGTVPQIARYEGIDTTKMVFSDAPGGGASDSEKEALLDMVRRNKITNTDRKDIQEKAVKEGWSDEFLDAQREGVQIDLTDTQQKQYNKEVDRFLSNPVVKGFEEGLTQFQSLSYALGDQSGPGDMAGVFAFMKTLDPTSVVREAEFDSAASSAGVGPRAANIYDRLTKGKVLTKGQADDFKKIAKKFIEAKAESYDRKYEDMINAFDKFGVDKELAPLKASDQLRNFLGQPSQGRGNTKENDSKGVDLKEDFQKFVENEYSGDADLSLYE